LALVLELFKLAYRRRHGQTGSKTCNSVSLQTKELEAVVRPLPVSMHTGQIIMLTKMLTQKDLRFYGFEAGAPVHRWR
jgi:hypothetical protein